MKVVQNKHAYEQVEQYIRDLILSGEWPSGVKLPINSVLAEQTGTSAFTVQTAMEHLCREGLLERKPRVGTYVKGQSARLTCAGIYFGGDLWSSSELGYYQSLYREIRKQWAELGIRTSVWIDDRLESEQGDLMPALRRAIERREIQALVAPLINGVDIEGLGKLKKIPLVVSSSLRCENRVWFDYQQLMTASLEKLKSQGVRTVGLISSVFIEKEKSPLGNENDKVEFYDAFLDEVKRLGMETSNAWIRSPEEHVVQLEQYGYQQLSAIWDQDRRPEGLVVYPDLTARGVVMSALAHQVSIPKELKLVLHFNDQCDYECPFPVTQIVTHVEDVAKKLIQQTHDLLGGKKIQQALMPFGVREN